MSNLIIIRIKGQVGLNADIKETLFRLRLRRKYAAIVVPEGKLPKTLINKIRNFVAYGSISDATLKKLIETRAKVIPGQKTDLSKAFKEIKESGISTVVKPYFRLHPPRKGINSKEHYPRGVLADHGDKINDLVERML